MKIKEPDVTFKNIRYGDSDAFNQLIEHLADQQSQEGSHLSVFLGLYEPDKKRAVRALSEATGMPIENIDLYEEVSKIETETYANIDRIFDRHEDSDSILYFLHGDRLSGFYTGYTFSKVKYASPQERYFLKKVRSHSGILIIDIQEYDDANQTLKRAAHSIVRFPLPKSWLKKMIWQLKHFSLHGYDIRAKRPESYDEAAGNY